MSPRRRALAAGAVVAVALLVWLVARSGDDGRTLYRHPARPSFTVLYDPARVRRDAPRNGELLRLSGRRGPLVTSVVARRIRLPAYRGDVAGLLPLRAEGTARALARRLGGFAVITDERTRVHDAPGYELGFTFTTPRGVGLGAELVLVPPGAAHPRDAVALSYRLTKPGGRRPRAQRRVAKAMRLALRSFEFGRDRD